MNNVVNFPIFHQQLECTSNVCGGMEGSLTSHCLGRKMTSKESDDVYENGWDFKNNDWKQIRLDGKLYSNPIFREMRNV